MFSPLSQILLLSSALTAFASPIQLSRREISADLLGNFELFSQYAALAACDQNINSTGVKLSCDYGTCGMVAADDTETIDAFHSDSGPTGYIALDHTKKLIVVAYRTSASTNDARVDVENTPKHIDEVCSGCWAHTGFWSYWAASADRVTSQLQDASKAHPDYAIKVVGHSLAGAVATLAGTVLRQKGFELEIYTYGSPKVGNLKLAEFITGQTSPSVYRATHYTDNAPKAPFNETSLDYTHSSPEYWINVPLKQEVTVDDVIYVEGINSKKGNAGHGSYSSTQLDQNHFFYFGPMQVCEYPADIDLSEAP